MDSVVRCSGLCKRYPAFQLGPLDLELAPGTILGFVGPNGSGKTTTMHCLTGLVRPDAGGAEICGHMVRQADSAWKAEVAFVNSRQTFFENWSAARNLGFLARVHPRWSADRAADLAGRFGLSLETRVGHLSRGNRVKLSIVAALAASPRLLLLDEPTAGLDPVVRDDVLGVLFELLERGDCAMLYSTHILSDISRLADELAFLVEGQLVLRQAVTDMVEEWRSITFRLAADPPLLRGTVRHERDGDDHRAISCDGAATMAHLAELGGDHIRPMPMRIEDIAVQVMKGGYRVAAGQS